MKKLPKDSWSHIASLRLRLPICVLESSFSFKVFLAVIVHGEFPKFMGILKFFVCLVIRWDRFCISETHILSSISSSSSRQLSEKVALRNWVNI